MVHMYKTSERIQEDAKAFGIFPATHQVTAFLSTAFFVKLIRDGQIATKRLHV